MLSTSTPSSIQQRRQQQQHRRQQSLEAPILAPPYPANARFQRPHPTHRRGLSLDQNLSMLTSPVEITNTRAHVLAGASTNGQYGGRQTVSIPLEPDYRHQPVPDTQHILQETQQHQPSQPGHIALDFSTHLQQQINGIVPQEMPFSAAEAKQQLQNHISWFQATYGESASGLTVAAPAEAHTQYVAHAPSTPLQQTMGLPLHHSQGQSNTVPNTPQRYTERARSPAVSSSKHNRSQSFQYDATPLTQTGLGDIFNPDTFGLPVASNYNLSGDHQSYASSAYSSSIADPMSPPFSNVMPTVPEDDFLAIDMLHGSSHLLQAAGSVTDDELDLHAPQPYSPRQAALLALGDINASIEETGISVEQVNQYMSDQCESDSKWTCLYPDCGKKFGRKENIRAHIQTHLGDRQFRCNDCGKCFVRQHDLKRHAKIHSGVKPNVCPCGMSFARQDALTRHRQRGTCFGVLPGFEKNDDERKKRGRPRKERPELETRIEKAVRARRMDAAASQAAAGAYRTMDDLSNAGSRYAGSASSESGASDHSSPLTPAPSSDIDDMLFNDFVSGHTAADCVPYSMHPEGSWMVDTPPTSPASYHTLPKTIAPTMLSSHASPEADSPASMDDVELALLAWRGDEQREILY
ncbi:hypothetical protein AMS68_001508 [Peltaster fructicola]|uniref:C2H2-type domain-containing protein n=1 Tax=Peltaster fructicola TaxID=286661 RepID=A0A6H0XMX1_9PEZI|nr:hypothetical protein AMS68_001508 [Peltaster fructicola]